MKIWIWFLLVLCLEIVAAHGDFSVSRDNEFLSYEKIDNPNRYPVEVYALGYSYRATDDFKRKFEIGKEKFERRIVRRDWNRDYFYRWSSWLRSYEIVECYRLAPRGKLFYIRCP